MKWWTWIWIGAITWLTVGGAWDDHRDRRSRLTIALGVSSGLVCIASVIAFSVDTFADILGRWLLPLSCIAGLLITAEAIRDVRSLSPDPELTARENRIIETLEVAAVALAVGGAVVVGILTGIKRW